ncbi:MAG: hypothetical protein E7654_02620 [Ruminococcaceae bacterium]|nr:hypothetical protein [Oscillospiraceae bacterium]
MSAARPQNREAVDEMKEYENRSMPQGLAMMLARDEAAMQNFARMDEESRRAVLDRARKVGSRAEMRQLVSGIAAGMTEGQNDAR